MNDALVISERLRAFHDLPWVIPAVMLLEFTDEDLDNLAAAGDNRDEYWHVLSRVVTRIRGEKGAA